THGDVPLAVRRFGLLVIAPVAEPRAGELADIDGPHLARRHRVTLLVEHAYREAGKRPADAAWLEDPLPRRDDGTHRLGGPVELPDRAGGEDVEDAPLEV